MCFRLPPANRVALLVALMTLVSSLQSAAAQTYFAAPTPVRVLLAVVPFVDVEATGRPGF